MTLVFLDTETTGLDPERHQIWEIACAIGDGPIDSSFVDHTLENADPAALVIGRYRERHDFEHVELGAAEGFEQELIRSLDGATLVGANPAFDAVFLKKRWGVAPWHYRLLDVCAFVAGARGLHHVPGLSEAAEMMGVEEQPDHTAAQDVRVTRAVFFAALEYVNDREKRANA